MGAGDRVKTLERPSRVPWICHGTPVGLQTEETKDLKLACLEIEAIHAPRPLAAWQGTNGRSGRLVNNSFAPAETSIPLETLQAFGLAGKVQQEHQRQRWLSALPEEQDPLPELELGRQVQAYLADLGLQGQTVVQQWMEQEGLGQAELALRARRHQLWLQVCEQQVGNKLASYFLQRKSNLDEVIYTMLPVAELDLCSEFYMQLKEGEISFQSLLQQLPPQPELGPRGQQGPIALAELPDGLAQLLRVSQPGQLWPPKPFQKGWILVRLDQSRPAVLDQQLRRRLLLELGQQLLNLDAALPKAQ